METSGSSLPFIHSHLYLRPDHSRHRVAVTLNIQGVYPCGGVSRSGTRRVDRKFRHRECAASLRYDISLAEPAILPRKLRATDGIWAWSCMGPRANRLSRLGP
jgi:hypothetical protein